MAWPAADAAPDAPKVQNRYRAESAGMARPDVIAVVCNKCQRDAVEKPESEQRTPTPGRILIKA
jgi:hypothetical protein